MWWKITANKNHSRTSPDVQFKEFSLTKQTSRPRKDHEWIGKTIFKKNQIKKFKTKTDNQCQNAACEQKATSEKRKNGLNKILGLEWSMNGLGKTFRKKSGLKILKKKSLKIKVKLPHVNTKPPARKRISLQAPFS